jgi:predicted permease
MFRSKRKPGDFSAELEAHLQIDVDRFLAQGVPEAEARAAARRGLGNRTSVEERFYESTRWMSLDLLWRDVRFGLRMLARSRVSTAIAILTLALGIGANTAVFSLLNAVLLRSLPVQRPQDLALFGKGQWMGSIDGLPNRSMQLFSYPFFREFRQNNRVFSDVAAVSSILFTTHGRVAGGQSLEKINAELVSGTYFHTLGVNPILGQTLSAADDQHPGAHPIAVASFSWWRRRLAQDPTVLGRTITIGQTVYSIVGVAPPEFFGVNVGQSPDVWIPLAMEKEISPGWNGLEKNLFQSLYVIGRRKPGVTMEQASANTNLLFQQIIHEYAGPQPSAKQVENMQHARIDLTSAATGLSMLRHQFFSPLMILMGVVALVLLIACANVANLLLARASARQREIAVRMSIGAVRSRLIRQLLVESSLLGLAGAALGVLLASSASRLLVLMVSTGTEALPLSVAPDAQVLGFTLAVSMLTVVLFGVAPAWQATNLKLAPALREGRGISVSPSRHRLARGLIVGQVALSLLLLAGAGLFLRSLINLTNIDTGFDRQNVLITGIDPVGGGYKEDARLENMMERVEERVGALAGVQAAAFSFFVFSGGEWTTAITVPGRPKSANDGDVNHNIVGPRYFAAMKMPIVLGRSLDERDNKAGRTVAVINETLARTYFPGGSPLGRTFRIGDDPDKENNPEWLEIEVVGVVKDAKYVDLNEKRMPAAFYPHAQHPGFLYTLVTRTTGNPKALVPAIQRAVAGVDPNLPVADSVTLAQKVDDSVLNQRLVAQLSTFFGILAAFLAAIGIYGVMSYGISRRTNEFGVRMALGAARRDVLWMVLRESLGLVFVGVAIGLALALAMSRLAISLFYGVKPYDPLAISLPIAAMIAIALLAGYLPARRATKIDPLIALRYE